METGPFLNACQSPWVVFPHLNPDELARHLKQGAAEPWFDEIWRPFWGRLSEGEKTDYLAHWSASEAWREAIRFHFDAAGIDLVADAAESERELEELRRPRERKSSFLSRLFGRR